MNAAAGFRGTGDGCRSPLAALALLLLASVSDHLGAIASRMNREANVALMSSVRTLRAQASL